MANFISYLIQYLKVLNHPISFYYSLDSFQKLNLPSHNDHVLLILIFPIQFQKKEVDLSIDEKLNSFIF